MKSIQLTVFMLAVLAGVAAASVRELVPGLTSSDPAVQTGALGELAIQCAQAGRPGADAERKALCKEMCGLLKADCPPAAATALVRNLQRIGGEESVATLTALLGSSDPVLRDDVRQALAVNPSPAAGEALRQELKKAKEPRWTAGLIQALGERREAGTSAQIAPYLKSPDAMVFTSAAKALSRLSEPDGIAALTARRGQETGVRQAALTAALIDTASPQVFQKLYAAGEPDEVRAVVLLGLIVSGDDQLAAQALSSGNAAFQSAAIEAALQAPRASLSEKLAGSLAGLPPHLQVQALGVLEFSGLKTLSKSVVPLMGSSDETVRTAAAQALAKIGDAGAVPALLAAGMTDPAARNALAAVDGQGIDDALAAAAAAGDGTKRAVAIQALGARGRVERMDSFLAYAAADDRKVADAAAAAIGNIGRTEDLGTVADLMVKRESAALLGATVSIVRRADNEAAAVALLSGKMAGASAKGQVLIMKALSQVGSDAALVPVAQAAKSNSALRSEAVKLLGNWSNDNAVPVLLEIAGDKSVAVTEYVLAMRGIARLLADQEKLNEQQAVQALKIARRAEEKRLMLGVLAKASGADARAAVEPCLKDPEVQADAEAALQKMGQPNDKKAAKGKKARKKQ